jgi:hypothetical protein
MTETERRELAQKMREAIRRGDIQETARLFDILDGKAEWREEASPKDDEAINVKA